MNIQDSNFKPLIPKNLRNSATFAMSVLIAGTIAKKAKF